MYHKWTLEEESIFRLAVAKYRHNWARIKARVLPHVSINSMKNKYYQKLHNNLEVGKSAARQEESSSRLSEEQVYEMIKSMISQKQ
ncbi:Myb-like_DNA-binding domain-containing protein [Hexamita inflata]|uniref:Myb-like DNA-binding domain-containing protein n=1 Tax=Hexamita inflata TaxID=28002 RepID=A0AA86U0T5_9EUKA|nr:Myb-like DNA-binding domain-containing protein [Hexamita inflata]